MIWFEILAGLAAIGSGCVIASMLWAAIYS